MSGNELLDDEVLLVVVGNTDPAFMIKYEVNELPSDTLSDIHKPEVLVGVHIESGDEIPQSMDTNIEPNMNLNMNRITEEIENIREKDSVECDQVEIQPLIDISRNHKRLRPQQIQVDAAEEHLWEPKEMVNEFVQLMQEQDKRSLKLFGQPFTQVTHGHFKCSYCRFQSVSKHSVLTHFTTRHCDNNYRCLACDGHFKRKDTLLHHETLCSAENSDLVRIARKMCKKPKLGSLSKNQRRALKKPCEICGKLISNNNMSTHLTVHSGVKRFMCSMCPSSFRSNKTLKAHHNAHMAMRPYICDQCPNSYTSPTALQAHKLDHRGNVYMCDYCGRGFKRKHRIIEHLLTHKSDGGEHTCKECGKSYNSKASLSQHLRSHGGKVPCTECDKTFRTMSQLMGHAKRIHGSLIIPRTKFLQILPHLMGNSSIETTVEFEEEVEEETL